jgi:YVTN family beta-propeller protein
MAEFPRGTVTFLFTDIEGSTHLVKELRERYADVLQEHQQLLRTAFQQAGGQEIDTQGDAFFVAFGRAKDAVLAAAAAQRALARHKWPRNGTVRVRMGIHSGEPTMGEDRYVGLGVHRAARICAAANGGQVLLSNATRELIEDDLPADVALRDLGEQRLKDIDRAEHLYQLLAPGLPHKFPPLRAPSEQAGGGRERELTAEAPVRPGQLSRRRPSRRILLLAALLLAAAVTAAILALTGALGGARAGAVPPHSLGVIDPKSNKLVGSIDLPNSASGLAVGAGSLWVADSLDQTLLRIDPKTHEIVKTIGIGFAPEAVTATSHAVWVAEHAGADNFASIREINPQTDQGGRALRLDIGGAQVTGLAADDEGIWLALLFNGVYRIEEGTDQPLGPVRSSGDTASLTLGDHVLWIAEGDDQVVSRVEPATRTVQLSIPFDAREPDSMAFGAGALWVADAGGDKVWRIDPVRNEVSGIIAVGDAPASIAVDGNAVWVANRGDGTVSRIDPDNGAVVSTIEVGKSVDGVAAGEGAVWVSVP